jgi:inositol polyphosphate 5-phosphatase INPP5B/F
VKAKAFCGTWNVNAKILDDGLLQWLCPPNSDFVDSNGTPNSDIYIVGFQEMVDLNVVNVASDSKSLQRSQYWQEKIAECLNSKGGKYTQILARHLVGLLLCVLVKDTALPHVRDVRGATAGVGVMGVMGNKGGVSIRLTLYDSSICIVCSHLAAHRENVAGRNGDFQSILEKTVFPPTGDGVNQGTWASTGEVESRGDKVRKLHYTTGLSPLEELTILDHDLVFWIGDLNYRIDESVSIDDVFARVELKDWAYLRQFDQLNNERAKNNVFHNFCEGELNFGPTYKFQPGTGEYDRRPEKKVRAPAWCDRVLWRENTSLDAVIQLAYLRGELFPSDHLPVMALFLCNIRKIVKEKETEVFQELMKELDKHENDSIPRVSIEGSLVNLSTLYFQVNKWSALRAMRQTIYLCRSHRMRRSESKMSEPRLLIGALSQN